MIIRPCVIKPHGAVEIIVIFIDVAVFINQIFNITAFVKQTVRVDNISLDRAKPFKGIAEIKI